MLSNIPRELTLDKYTTTHESVELWEVYFDVYITHIAVRLDNYLYNCDFWQWESI